MVCPAGVSWRVVVVIRQPHPSQGEYYAIPAGSFQSYLFGGPLAKKSPESCHPEQSPKGVVEGSPTPRYLRSFGSLRSLRMTTSRFRLPLAKKIGNLAIKLRAEH
jgi:hypothetical protein